MHRRISLCVVLALAAATCATTGCKPEKASEADQAKRRQKESPRS